MIKRFYINTSSFNHAILRWCDSFESIRVAMGLLGKAQRFAFTCLIAARITVGFCDLLLALAMYYLFLLLQGVSLSTHRLWTPRSTLSAALLTATLVLMRTLLDLTATRAVVSHIHKLYTELLLQLTQGYNEMQWVRFAERNRSEILNHTTHSAREAANFYNIGIEMIAAAVVVVAMSVVLIYQNPLAGFSICLAIGIFYAIHRFLIRKKLQNSAAQREQSLGVLQRSLADMLASGKEIRSYRAEKFFHNRIKGQARAAEFLHRQVALLPQIARILADQGVLLLFLCLIIATQLHHGEVRKVLSLLVFYFLLSRRLLPLISQIFFLAGQMESSYKSLRIVYHELNECFWHRTTASTTLKPGSGLAIELDRVSFSFARGPLILRDVTLRLCKGETIVLQGASGSGKSTLLNLIAGVLQPVGGEVRLDREHFAYVPQDVSLLDDSIRNNLLFGIADKSDAELMSALTVANFANFVMAQPLGLDSAVGDNGVLLSGGQRQRLGLARAVLRAPRLLLLDEATSALDEVNESQVLKNLSASGVSIVFVSHHIHDLGFVHRLLRLEQGVLVEEPSGKSVTGGAQDVVCRSKHY